MTTLAASPSTFVWVAKNGNDAKARRGRIDLPFLTIQAGLNAALAGDAILVAPGTYPENLVIPDIDGLAIVGENTTTTIITAALGRTISWVPAAGPGALVRSFNLAKLTVSNTDPLSNTIHVDGTAVSDPNTFCGSFFCDEIAVTHSGAGIPMNMICVGRVITSLSTFTGNTGGGVRIRNCSRFQATESSIASSVLLPSTVLDLGWDRGAGVIPGLGREGYYLSNSTFIGSNTVLSGQPIFSLGVGCTMLGTLTTALTFFAGVGVNQGPVIYLNGSNGAFVDPAGSGYVTPPFAGVGNVTITLPLTTGGLPRMILDMSGGRFYGPVTLVAAGPNRQSVNAKGAIFYAASAGNISAGAFIDLDLRGATFAQAALAVVGSGAIDRDKVTIQAASVAPAGTAIVFAIPFPSTVTTQYTPQFTPTAIPATALAVAITARTATGFTATAVGVAVAATGDFVVTRAA